MRNLWLSAVVLCSMAGVAHSAEWAWFQACKHESSEVSGPFTYNGIEITGAFRLRLANIMIVAHIGDDKCTMIHTGNGNTVAVVGSIADVCERIEGKPGCEKQ